MLELEGQSDAAQLQLQGSRRTKLCVICFSKVTSTVFCYLPFTEMEGTISSADWDINPKLPGALHSLERPWQPWAASGEVPML